MGLDTVELLVSVEDSFGIHIEDEEFAQAVTLGDLHRIVCEKIGGTPAHRCLTSAAFYRVRQAIVQTLPANRRSVRPGTRLTDLLPEAQRRERWRTIEWTSGLRFPALRHCGAIQCALLGTGVTASLAPGLASGLSSGWLALLGTAGVVAGAGLVKLTPFLAVEFPYGVETVGDLVREVLAQNYARLASGNGVCNDREVWATIRRLVARQTGIEEDAIVPAATPRDVGLDWAIGRSHLLCRARSCQAGIERRVGPCSLSGGPKEHANLREPPCASPGIIAGQRVVQFTEHNSEGPGRSIALAPALGCEVMEIVETSPGVFAFLRKQWRYRKLSYTRSQLVSPA